MESKSNEEMETGAGMKRVPGVKEVSFYLNVDHYNSTGYAGV